MTSESLMTKRYQRGARATRDGTCKFPGFGPRGGAPPLGTGKRPSRGDQGGAGSRLLSGGRTRTPGCLVGFRAIDFGAPHTMVTSAKKVKLSEIQGFSTLVGRRVDVGTSGSSPWPRRRMYHSHRVCSTRIFNASTSRVGNPHVCIQRGRKETFSATSSLSIPKSRNRSSRNFFTS